MTTAQNTERTAQAGGSGREIEAQLHGQPPSHVSRLFDASLRHAIDEVLQNARRAGATLVDIETSEDGSIRITDNGRGIADPEVLLAFGESDWDTATSQQEHAHGAGLFALARWNPTIRSRPAGRPGKAWRVSLTEDHFRGAAKATVRSDNEGAPEPHGTEVTIREADAGGTKASAMRTRTTNERIETAARHYPVKVRLNGEVVERHDYLAHCAWMHNAEGLWFGVGTETWRLQYSGEMNFHGKHVDSAGLPRVNDIDGRIWSAQVDVREAPDLELTLPPESTVVEGPFVTRMREEAERAIYLGIAQAGRHVNHSIRKRAAAVGVNIPGPARKLQAWRPERPSGQKPDRGEATEINGACLIMVAEMTASDSQLLGRAVAGTALAHELREQNPSFAGYDWYDKLPRVRGMRIQARNGNQVRIRQTDEERTDPAPAARCDNIMLVLTIDTAGSPTERLVATDVAFWDTNDDDVDVRDVRATVQNEATIKREELRELLTNAFFWASHEHGSDSYATQRERFEREADIRAGELLDCRGAAAASVMEQIARQHMLPQIGRDQKAVVVLDGDSGNISVEIDDQPAGPQ